MLKRPIHVTLSANGNVIRYNDAKFAPAPPVMLLYSSFGDSAGHYDCILPSHVSVSVISPLPLPLSQVTKRPARKTEAEVLTDSPHKNKLLSAKNKTKKNNDSKSNKQHKKAKGKKTKKRATARSSNSEDAAWYCFMCRECSPEDMIQCFHCLRWAHEECAGTQTNNTAYQCDMCQRK